MNTNKERAFATCLFRAPAGFEIYNLSLAEVFPPHFHDYCLIGCLLAGRRETRINNLNRTARPGELLIIHPFQPHSCRGASEANVWRSLAIPDAIWRSFAFSAQRGNFFALNSSLEKRFLRICDDIRRGADRSTLKNFLSSLTPTARVSVELSAPDERLLDVAERMKRDPGDKNKLDDLAELARMDKYEFIRNFAAAFHITPHKYVESLRLAKGQGLLREGRSVIQSALAAGCCDQSHFNRLFRRYLGVAPAVYRGAADPRREDFFRVR